MRMKRFHNFSGAVDQIKPLMSTKRHDSLEPQDPFALGRALLDMPGFPEFAAAFFQKRDIWNDIKEELQYNTYENSLPGQGHKIPSQQHGFYLDAAPEQSKHFKVPPKAGKTILKEFENLNIPTKPVRKRAAYPLTQNETDQANGFLNQEEDFFLAIVGVKYCIATYYDHLSDALRDCFASDEFYEELDPQAEKQYLRYMAKLIQNIHGTAFTEELAPVLANDLRHAEDSHDKQSLQKAFRHLFERSAFANYDYQSFNQPYNQCPFAKSLMKAMQLELKRGDDGTVSPVGRSYTGALINFARAEITAFEAGMTANRPDLVENHTL